MEKEKIIVAVVWGNPANECIHAYFFTEKNGRKQGWCAEMAMQEPKLRTAIFKMDKIRPTTKPDVSNVLKGIEDALSGVWYEDDSQIVEYGKIGNGTLMNRACMCGWMWR